MRLFELLLKVNGKFSFVRKISQSYVKKAVLDPNKRKKLNSIYHRLTFYEKSIFHALFSRIFRDGNFHSIDSFWIVKFAGRDLKMPLQSESLALDWETAVSIVAHDYEIKSYYEERILSTNPPKTFLDIGANFGTHSLLFLKCGIRAVSIEPNPECKAYFERMCEINQVEGEWYAIALGEEKGEAELVFPEGETWLGSLKKSEFGKHEKLISYKIPVNKLDDFLDIYGIQPDLIKFDTEGFEKAVLKGGQKCLVEKHPEIIFEANSKKEYIELTSLLQTLNYKIVNIKSGFLLKHKDVLKDSNFLAKGN
jgi:FkbM family methyltransferase